MTGQTATPTAFPAPGTFGVTQRITLLCETPNASIHYTLDGSVPDQHSPQFDPYVLPVLEALSDGDRGLSTTYTLNAIAYSPALPPSQVASFVYTLNRRDTDVYVTSEVSPGIYQIRDFDDTNMYVVLGSQRALLIDAGLGNGNLRKLVEELAGERALDVVITHGHPDHIAAMGQFQDRYNVYMNHRDVPMVQTFVERMGFQIDLEQIEDLHEGWVFDLGDRVFEVYEVPGHSLGHTVLFEPATGILLASDAVGSNRPTITDSLWMQFPGMLPIDAYLSSLQIFRAKLAGRIATIYGGHNDGPFIGEAYLDNLQLAAQRLVDHGDEVLLPSLRPTDAWQVVVGDRLSDPNWAAINVAKSTCLSAPPEQIATLSNLQLVGATLEPAFTQNHNEYTIIAAPDAQAISITPTATSTRHRSLTVNGAPHSSGEAHTLPPCTSSLVITVVSPDGSVTKHYTFTIV